MCVCVYEKQLFCTQENKKHKIVEPGEKGKLKSESVITITYFLKSTLGCRARRRVLNRPQGFLCIEETKLRVWGSKVTEHTTQSTRGERTSSRSAPDTCTRFSLSLQLNTEQCTRVKRIPRLQKEPSKGADRTIPWFLTGPMKFLLITFKRKSPINIQNSEQHIQNLMTLEVEVDYAILLPHKNV